jgi:hypothetical protein
VRRQSLLYSCGDNPDFEIVSAVRRLVCILHGGLPNMTHSPAPCFCRTEI